MGLFSLESISRNLRRIKPGLVVLGWGISIASLAMTGILQGIIIPHSAQYTPQGGSVLLGVVLYYAGIFGISVIAGLMLADIGAAVLGFFAAYGIGIILTYFALDSPGLAGVIPEAAAELPAIAFTFTALFPFALLLGLVGGLIGAASSELPD